MRSWESNATDDFIQGPTFGMENIERGNHQSVIGVAGMHCDQKSSAGSLVLPLQGPRLASRRLSLGDDFCDERYGKRLGNHVEIGRGEEGWPRGQKSVSPSSPLEIGVSAALTSREPGACRATWLNYG